MWKTVDYKGNTVKWYEAELIERIRKECEQTEKYYSDCIIKNRETHGQFMDEESMTWLTGRAYNAGEILRLIQENEK